VVDPISVFPPISAAGRAVGVGGAAAAAAVPTSALFGAAFPPLALSFLPFALQARGGPFEPERERFPGIKPGDLLKAALDIQALSEAGQVPVASTDPFTGDLVVSTADQGPVLETLLGERFAREELRATPEEVGEVLTFREEVVRNLAVPTARVVAPGVVARRTSDLAKVSRLGGPCAGANTGFYRLNCARGGFA